MAVLRYQPIENGQMWGVANEQADDNPLRSADVQDHSNSGAAERQIRLRSEGRFIVHITLRNDGRWPVRIVDLPLPTEGVALGDGVRIGRPGSHDLPSSSFGPFRPIDLGPGEFVYVTLRYRLGRCPEVATPTDEEWADRRGTVEAAFTTQRVDYEVFGIARHMELELPATIAVMTSERQASHPCNRASQGPLP